MPSSECAPECACGSGGGGGGAGAVGWPMSSHSKKRRAHLPILGHSVWVDGPTDEMIHPSSGRMKQQKEGEGGKDGESGKSGKGRRIAFCGRKKEMIGTKDTKQGRVIGAKANSK